MSRFYEIACKKVSNRLGPTREEIEEKKEKRKKNYVQKGKEHRKTESKLKEAKIIHGEDSKGYEKLKNKHDRTKKELESAEELYKRKKFKKTTYVTNLDLEYEEVLIFSIFTSLLTFILILVSIIVLHQFYPLSLYEILIYVLPTLLILPMAVLIFTADYPDILESRLKAETIGKAPESINYMTMSMRVTPSLYRAVQFSADNTEPPISTGLKKVLWDVYTRKKSSLEESFISFAMEWGEWNKDLKRALYSVRSAMLERTKEGLNSSLEKANDIIISGTKRQVEDFANSLGTPTTILFAIGILLPLIIGAMLPMVALGGLDITSTTTDEVTQSSIGISHTVLLMDIIAPLGAFLYSYKILGDRPGTSSPPEIDKEGDERKILVQAFFLTILLTAAVIFFSAQLSLLMPLPYFWPPIVFISYYFLKTSWKKRKLRKEIIDMEREFPDALFQLGSRIAEGMPPERAFLKTSESMKGTKVGDLLQKISCTLQINRLPLEEALFGERGILENHPSRTIKATMKTVVDITKKDPQEAGKTIIQISNYLRDMEEMDHDIKSRLSQSVEMMKGTALVFAPVVMGVVSSLYFMLYSIFSEITNMQMISPVAFTAVVAVYLVLMSIVITYFTTGIRSRLDPVEFKYNIGIILPVSIAVFSMSLLIGKIGIG
ncbi:MAG: hypothetical protein R6U61_05920 [Thermoplasmata archaeon]